MAKPKMRIVGDHELVTLGAAAAACIMPPTARQPGGACSKTNFRHHALKRGRIRYVQLLNPHGKHAYGFYVGEVKAFCEEQGWTFETIFVPDHRVSEDDTEIGAMRPRMRY